MRVWIVPDGSDQDIVFEETWIEVKAITLASNTVKISSLEQLHQETREHTEFKRNKEPQQTVMKIL